MPGKVRNIAGLKFGHLTAVRFLRIGTGAIWECRCDCGNIVERSLYSITRRGGVGSCGCAARMNVSAALIRRNTKHGMAKTPTWRVWMAMRARCGDKNNQDYIHYGGRGITVCKRWQSFSNFYADMGPRPDGKSIDRIDNNGNYEPANCRWATHSEQVRNRRPRSEWSHA